MTLGSLSVEERKGANGFHAVTDDSRLFLLAHTGRSPRTEGVRGPGLSPSTPIDGRVIAFDLTGGRLWGREISHQFLVTDEFDRQPCLLFARRLNPNDVPDGVSLTRTEILAWDRDTGRELITASLPTVNGLQGLWASRRATPSTCSATACGGDCRAGTKSDELGNDANRSASR